MRSDTEVTRWSGQPAWREYVFLWFFTLVFGVRAALALWMAQPVAMAIYASGMVTFVGLAAFFRATTRYTVTQEAIYRTVGLLGRAEHRLPLSEVTSVSVRSSPVDRLLGIGTVLLQCADGTAERLAGLPDPDVLRRKIEAMLSPRRSD